MTIFLGIVALIFSAFVAFFTLKVAQYTKEYTEETRRLWEITKKSYFVKAVADYIFGKHYDHIEKWPSFSANWCKWVKWPPPEERKPQIFKSDCHRVILEELFPDIRETEEKVVKKLGEEGYKFGKEEEK